VLGMWEGAATRRFMWVHRGGRGPSAQAQTLPPPPPRVHAGTATTSCMQVHGEACMGVTGTENGERERKCRGRARRRAHRNRGGGRVDPHDPGEVGDEVGRQAVCRLRGAGAPRFAAMDPRSKGPPQRYGCAKVLPGTPLRRAPHANTLPPVRVWLGKRPYCNNPPLQNWAGPKEFRAHSKQAARTARSWAEGGNGRRGDAAPGHVNRSRRGTTSAGPAPPRDPPAGGQRSGA
jgi:hypothetical protein